MSYWLSDIPLSKSNQKRIRDIIRLNAEKARLKSKVIRQEQKRLYLEQLFNKHRHLNKRLLTRHIALITLSALYLAEGSNAPSRRTVMFGNSNPSIVSLFLILLRYCFAVDESRFRCTLQCRADQNIKELEKFWSEVTKIPLSQFYTARIDPRSIGKKSKKPDYKGVCRIDYFSPKVLIEMQQIGKIITAN